MHGKVPAAIRAHVDRGCPPHASYSDGYKSGGRVILDWSGLLMGAGVGVG
jgi:hypothetical protein